MELILLLVIAGLAGYFLAGSRLSKPIDEAASKVTETSKDVAGKTKSWWEGRFGKRQKAEPKPAGPSKEVVVMEEVRKPAEKSVSRRKSETADETDQVTPEQ